MTTLRVLVLLPALLLAPVVQAQPKAPRLPLTSWKIESSAKVTQPGDVVSTPAFAPQGWRAATVPTTVVGASIERKAVPEIYTGMNLRQLAGVTYKVGANFSNAAMAPESPYAVPWWYRTQFTIPAAFKGKTLWLAFDGINYRANIWLNGKRIASSEEIAGAWRTYELNVTEVAKPGATNVLAVEVWAQTEKDLGITFVDWNPAPPDKNMGLWRGVALVASGPVALRHPAVVSQLGPENESAQLTVTALVKNGAAAPVKGKLKGRIEGLTFEQEIELAPGERKDVAFTPEQFPQLKMEKPRLWWPAQMGTPNLYDLKLELVVDGKRSDEASTSFGVREVKSELNAQKKRFFTINGKKILIRGAGWSTDMLMRSDRGRMEDELRYVQDMGLNTVRLEGKIETDEFFEYTDRHGLLVMAGWCCCDHWEHWKKWTPADHVIAAASLRDQLYRLRQHPSVFVWLNASDGPPPEDVERRYLDVEKELRWPNPVVSSAADKPTKVTGESGVKMTGPYDYVAPRYWLEDTKHGGAHGFNTETSPGPAVPPIESLRKMLGNDHLWPIDETWLMHAGGGKFDNIKLFTEALDNRYGKASSAEDYATKSQLMAYEGIRAMFEAYSRNKYTATGVIQWMLNNAWPGLIWHLYDYYLRPAGGYFGAKKACEPVHPVYSLTDGSVWVVNSTYAAVGGLKLGVKAFNLDMTETFSSEAAVDLEPDSGKNVLTVPPLKNASAVYFVQLTLTDAAGKRVGSSFYWLPTRHDALNYEKSDWYFTPSTAFADFSALAQLPPVTLKTASKTARKGADSVTTVTIENPSKSLAFFVRLKVNKGAAGEEILPVLWQDNYFSLLPGEKREVTATYRARELGGAKPAVEVSGWNVAR